MVRRAVLHIGMDGTGTSSIQRSLHRDRVHLQENGVRLLEAGRPADDVAKTVVNWRRDQDSTWDTMAEELRALKDFDGTIVLSNELLWLQQPRVLFRLRSLLGDRSVVSVVYLREQADYMQWRVLQNQKKLEKAFDFRDSEAFGRFARGRRLDYFEMCRRFESVFGSGSVVGRIYDRSKLTGNDVVSDFYEQLGVPLPEPSPGWPSANPSMNADFADLIRERRAELVKQHPIADLIDVALRLSHEGLGERYFLPEQDVDQIRSSFSTSNQRLAARYLLDGAEIPNHAACSSGAAADLDHLQEQLLDAARTAPKLGKGWSGNPANAPRLFNKGWRLEPSEDGESVKALVSESDVNLRFRTSFQRETRLGPSGFQLFVRTDGDQPFEADVSVNEEHVGTHVFPGDPIAIRPPGATHRVTEVAIRSSDHESLPAVVGLDLEDAMH